MDEQPEGLPAGLAELPPGPELSSVLAGIDRSRVGADELHDLCLARARLLAHVQAELLADVWETGRATRQPAGSLSRNEGIDEFSGDELAWTLSWSRSYTHSQLLAAQQLFTRLPAVYAVFLAGRIDFVKADAFISVLYDLDDEAARRVADRLLDRAGRWTLADLRERLRYHAGRADPAAAKKRYQRKVADRDVRAHADVDGTACLAGSNLPPDQALAAQNRVARLARTARAGGDPRTLAQLRADAFLALLAGIPFQTTPPTTPLTAEADALYPAHTDEDDGGASDARRRGSDADPDSRSQTRNHQDTGDANEDGPIGIGTFGEDIDPAQADSWFETRNTDTGGNAMPATDNADTISRSETGNASPAADGGDRCACGGVQPKFRRGVVDLQVKLSTLMCLNEDPALIPGWGPVIADIARQVAEDREANPAWLWTVTDEHGRVLHHGHTRRRPTASEKAFVKARDRTCRARGCRRPAIDCDDDHRQEHANGGPSHRGNLCCLCTLCRRRHNRHYAAQRIMPRSVLKSLRCKASVAESAA